MLICISDLLTVDELAQVRQLERKLHFVDGRATAGWHAAQVKHNAQAATSKTTSALQRLILGALERSVLFQIATRPRHILPPLFSRYQPGMDYGRHVDDAVMGGKTPLRADIAVTLFLSDPDTYEGGELIVESAAGEEAYKLDSGSAVVYPASSLHRVAPLTRGVRFAAVTWMQSMVRDPSRRELLFDLDTARRAVFAQGNRSEFDLLSKSLANLMRMWAEV